MRIITTVLFRSLLLISLLSISFSSFSTTAKNNTLPAANASVQADDEILMMESMGVAAKMETAKPAVNIASAAPGDGENPYATKINWLLFIVAVLLIMVIGQVLNILSKVGEIQGKPVINWSSVNGKLLLAFLVTGMAAAIWEFIAHGKYTVNAQEAASDHGAIYDNMFVITLVITGVVFVITQILLFWYGFKYKADGKRKALYYPDNHKIEFIWTIIPAVVLTLLVIRGLKTWNNIMSHRDEKAAVIEIFGYQFGWNARYSGEDNKLGNHDFRQIGVANAYGVDPKDPKAQDDIVTTELHFEVNKPVSLKFRAKDVIHSAFLPHFRVQMNVVPGLPTQFNFTPTVTTTEMKEKLKDPKFDYVLLCNKICGGAHYRMKMKVVVDSPEDYKKWLSEQPKLVTTNAPESDQPILDSTVSPIKGAEAQTSIITPSTITLAGK